MEQKQHTFTCSNGPIFAFTDLLTARRINMRKPSVRCLILWLLLCSSVLAIDFKVGVITENSVINSSLIQLAFDRRVNYNWRVLQAHTLSFVQINVTTCSSQQAVRTVCLQSALSALIGVGSCSLLDQVISLSNSLQLPLIALPTGVCDSAQLIKDSSGLVAVGSHSSDQLVAAAASVIVSDQEVSQVAILYDQIQSISVLQNLQSSLTSARVSTLTFQVDNSANASVSSDLVLHLRRLIKKKVFKLIVLAAPRNALSVLRYANDAGVMQQNYFWLIVDTGVSKAELRNVTPPNANVALVRGSVFGACTSGVQDVFNQCDMEWVRTLDGRFVDAVEAIAKALNDSLSDPGFSVSNASCSPLQQWRSGSLVYNKLISIINYDTQRGIVSYNSSSRHFSSQGVQLVASYNELRSSPMSLVESAVFDPSSGALSKKFRYKGVSLAFPNTFMGFKNETLLICTLEAAPKVIYDRIYPNSSLVNISGMVNDVLKIVSEKLDFRFVTKDADDGYFGSPQAGSTVFTGCVGEVQRGLVALGASSFTKTSVRSRVIDFSVPLFQESVAVLVPRPPPGSKMWNIFSPLSLSLWLALIGFVTLSAIFTWLFAFFSPFSAYNLGLDYAFADEIWLKEYIWTVMGSFLLQGQDFYPFAISPRTVMAFWWMFTVIIYAAYTGDLTAHLTVTITDFPIKTLEDLANQNEIRPAVFEGTNILTLFLQAKSGIYYRLAQKLEVLDNGEACPDDPPRMDRACIMDYTTLLAIVMKNCSQFYLVQERFNTAAIAFIYPMDAYFASLFDFHMQKLHETGVIQRLFGIYWSSDEPCSVGTSTEADPINLEDVSGCYLITGILYGIGLVIMVFELVWTRLLNQEPDNCIIY